MNGIQNLRHMIDLLKGNPRVLGMVRFGGCSQDVMSPEGDFDLFVFVEDRDWDIDSIHFYVGDIPVDLAIRTLGDPQSEEPFAHAALVNGEILYDRTGAVHTEMETLKERWEPDQRALTEVERSFARLAGEDALDEIQRQLDSDPLSCSFVLNTNINELVKTYFEVRSIPFDGERKALEWFKENDTDVYGDLQNFFAASVVS